MSGTPYSALLARIANALETIAMRMPVQAPVPDPWLPTSPLRGDMPEPDEIEMRWNIRKCDNRIAVVIAKTPHNTYASYERLVEGRTGGVVDADTREWKFIPGTAVGMGDKDPFPTARRMYDAAPARFGPKGNRT